MGVYYKTYTIYTLKHRQFCPLSENVTIEARGLFESSASKQREPFSCPIDSNVILPLKVLGKNTNVGTFQTVIFNLMYTNYIYIILCIIYTVYMQIWYYIYISSKVCSQWDFSDATYSFWVLVSCLSGTLAGLSVCYHLLSQQRGVSYLQIIYLCFWLIFLTVYPLLSASYFIFSVHLLTRFHAL